MCFAGSICHRSLKALRVRAPPSTCKHTALSKRSSSLQVATLLRCPPAAIQFWDLLPKTWPFFAIVSVLGFVVNITSFLVIQRTNVIMLKLLSISRNALVVFAGIICFSETVTLYQFAGYSITLVSFVVYSVLQVSETRR